MVCKTCSECFFSAAKVQNTIPLKVEAVLHQPMPDQLQYLPDTVQCVRQQYTLLPSSPPSPMSSRSRCSCGRAPVASAHLNNESVAKTMHLRRVHLSHRDFQGRRA